MLKQVDDSNWQPMYDSVSLCSTRLSVQNMEDRFSLEFARYWEDGLGDCFAAIVEINKQLYLLRGFTDKQNSDMGVEVRMQGNNPSVEKSLAHVTEALNISTSNLNWFQHELTAPTWSLIRQGDDGNEVEVSRFYHRRVAEHVMQVYEARGHKQCYMVRNINEGSIV